MYYESQARVLRLSVAEAVKAAYARYAKSVEDEDALGEITVLGAHPAEAMPKGKAKGARNTAPAGAVLFSRAFLLGSLSVELLGMATPTADGDGSITAVTLHAETAGDPDALPEAAKRYLRGVAFVTARLVCEERAVPVSTVLHSIPYGKTVTLTEAPTHSDLARFWERVEKALLRDAEHRIERAAKRLPTFSAVPFPYGEAREGQKDMMSAVYSAAKHGETLFAAAPTGTGKTMAALFPAVRALGAGYIDKVFYLTPKNTSAIAAADAVELLRKKGALLRAVCLSSKEHLCSRWRENQSCYRCPLSHGKKQAEEAALLALLAEDQAAIKEADILRVAHTYGVCPHELGLNYSLYADIVIGDYNYLFDPRAALVRYFTDGGEYLFLVDEAHNLPDRAREMYSGEIDSDAFARLTALFAPSARLSEIAHRFEDVFRKTVDGMLKGELREDENGVPVGFASSSALPAAFATALGKCTDVFLKEIKPRGGKESEEDRLLRQAVYSLRALRAKLDAFDEHFVTYAIREGDARRLRFYCIDPSVLIGKRLDKGRAAVFFSATLAPADYYRSVLCGNRPTVKIEVPSPFEVGALCVGVVDSTSVRATAREDTLPEIARLIISAMKARRGNYMVFCPSFSYLEKVAEAFHRLTPKTPIAVQKRNMSVSEREAFLDAFRADTRGYFVGFCVTGGIYAEGIDLVGDRLIGAIVIGMGLPQVSAEREVISAYYQDIAEEGKQYAYLYPALCRILQAAGRVIRTEEDRGIVVLIDDRLRDPVCRKIFPPTWKHLKYIPDKNSLTEYLTRFWESVDAETQ